MKLFKKKNSNSCLENHPLGNQNIYRLHYMDFYEGKEKTNFKVVNWWFKPFMLPKGMNREDAFKVLSYLTNYIKDKIKGVPNSISAIVRLNALLNIPSLGFTRIDDTINDDDIIELFTITGKRHLFQNNSLYSKYFDWYVKDVTKEEVRNIYAKINQEFVEPVYGVQKRRKIL